MKEKEARCSRRIHCGPRVFGVGGAVRDFNTPLTALLWGDFEEAHSWSVGFNLPSLALFTVHSSCSL